MYHVRAVTQTDVVRAGTKEVAKIFQILYDVDAVNGPGSIAYLGATSEIQSKRSNPALYSTVLENPLSINNISMSTTTLHVDNLSDSVVGNSTIRSGNGAIEEYTGRLSSDAISVGSNDSGDVLINNHILLYLVF